MSYLVEMKDVLNFLGLSAETTADKNIDLIRLGVEEWIQTVYCRKRLTLTSHKERYDGTGTKDLYLDHYPVVSLNRLAVDTNDAISIKNTNVTANSSVSVSATAVTLYSDGTTSTLALATYTTLSALVAAINAVAGWSASLNLDTYGTYPSTDLVEKFGLYCGNNTTTHLEIPDEGEYDFEVYPNEGRIFFWFGFPRGHRNIFVDYTAGYATIPDDLKLATCILIKNIYQRRLEESFGTNSYSISGISMSFEQDLPMQARQILDGYRRILV
jgi:hypothetical protein